MAANMLRRWQGSQAEAHATRSLMARAAHGFAWVFAWRMATRLMGLGSTLILVRLLAPAEFGLVAIALWSGCHRPTSAFMTPPSP